MANDVEALKAAIDRDDAAAVGAVLVAGTDANAEVAGGTALGYAVGTFRPAAARALIAGGADPNRRDRGGENAVTLAVQAYGRDPTLLQMVLAAGGDPNTRMRDRDPIVIQFIAARDLQAIERLHAAGADLSANERDGRPMIVNTASARDWDVVLKMLELGVDPREPAIREGLEFIFKRPTGPSPDSPIYPHKMAVWRRLHAAGLNVPAPDAAGTRQ